MISFPLFILILFHIVIIVSNTKDVFEFVFSFVSYVRLGFDRGISTPAESVQGFE